jgi:RNA polymerase sigma-70 factor (ECF subfamily)
MRRGLAKIIPLRRPSTDVAELSDEAVIAACATDDPVARAQLFERHVDVVHRFIARMWHDPAVVDDLVQATFVAAYRSAGRFRPGARVRPWLFGIAANLTRDHARREGRRKRAMSEVAAWHDVEPRTALDVADRERLARLPDAIAALTHDQRAALVMVDVEGQSGKDAAAALGVPEGTLWRRLYDARRAIRALVDGGPS